MCGGIRAYQAYADLPCVCLSDKLVLLVVRPPQYEEVSASSQLQSHLPQLVAGSLELAAGAGPGQQLAEAEATAGQLQQLLAGKIGEDGRVSMLAKKGTVS